MPSLRQERYKALAKAISRVLTPVTICIILSIWFVHGLGNRTRCGDGKPRQVIEIQLFQGEQSSSQTRSVRARAKLWAGIFLSVFAVLIVLLTFFIVWLYKSGRKKVIQGWILGSMMVIFAYVGGLYIFDFCRSHCINLDWISLSLAVWNFTISGLFAVFGVVPRVINQAYLVVMSALMAYVFRTLPAWSIWTILTFLVFWDLFAVLSKHGPLRKLIEAAKEQRDALPALIYDTNPQNIDDPREEAPSRTNRKDISRKRETQGEGFYRTADFDNDDDFQLGILDAHLKMGLGDFVFYSILVTEASKSSAMTAITSFVAILTGLCATLFPVVAYGKPLPALPISITVGLLFFVLTRYAIQPFASNLLPELLFY